jgi:hypothetical protein
MQDASSLRFGVGFVIVVVVVDGGGGSGGGWGEALAEVA